MFRILKAPVSISVLLAILLVSPVQAQEPAPISPPQAEEVASDLKSAEELETIVARIALYPDDLVAVVMSGSLFPLQIIQASRFLEQKKTKPDLEPSKDWDGSVISLLNYPDVLKIMNDDLAWTEALGTAVANQQKDVLDAIQQLRQKALASNVIASNDQVVVEKEKTNVVIRSVKEEVTYVPVYDEQVLLTPNYVATQPIYYGDPYPSYYYPYAPYWPGFIAGAVWGAWVDWDNGGCWGGDVDIDLGDINIDRDKFNNRVDHHDFDRNRDNLKFDRNQIKDSVRNRPENRLDKKRNTEVARQRDKASKVGGAGSKDIRRDVQQGLQRPDGKPGIERRPSGGQARPDRPGGDRPKAAQKPAQGPVKKAAQRPSQKPAARPDNRPRQPSAVGDYGRGQMSHKASQRGRSSYSSGGGGGQRFQSRGGRGGGGRGGGGRRR